MELRYPFVIVILVLLVIASFFLFKNKKKNYTAGSKIANTHYVKNTSYFKKKLKEYKIMITLIQVACIIGIISSIVLISRLARVETTNMNEYNRDIFLCMDVSSSVDDLNLELVETLKDTVTSLKGERFGISIFNSSSVILVPLTDDYDYVASILDKIKTSIEVNNNISSISSDDKDYFYYRNYVLSGTLEGNEQRGSSLIGDGLTSCVYSFSNLEEERTRIIIFTTDNDLAGTPLVTLDKAAQISKKNGIKVFGIGTKLMYSKDKTEYENAVLATGGKFYLHSNSTVGDIVSDIESTSKSLLKDQVITKKIDMPQVPFLILVLSVFALILIGKKVKS